VDSPNRCARPPACWADRHFLWLLLAAYALAAAAPAAGVWCSAVPLAELGPAGAAVRLTPQGALLALLLFAAALSVPAERVVGLVRRPQLLVAGLAASLLAPLGLIAVAAHLFPAAAADPDRAAAVLLGLGVVAAMPVAGSSAAWAGKAGGDVALSLGLVLGSTLLSPLTVPLALGVIGSALGTPVPGGSQVGSFLAGCVLVPTAAGLLASRLIGSARVRRLRPALKAFNLVALLALVYTGASAALAPGLSGLGLDPVFAVAALGLAAAFCAASFAAGWAVARALRAAPGEETALVFGLGMSNNGTGMVLAATAAVGGPVVMMVLAAYTLIQHLAAGLVDLARSGRTAVRVA
jgi:BASS family bile acid:Na+ symporter